jgi:hypothetical protein
MPNIQKNDYMYVMRIYKLDISAELDDNIEVDFNSLVSTPAHLKKAFLFNEQKVLAFKEDERIVYGVMIAADLPIRRIDESGEYHVIFEAETVKKIREKYIKKGYNNRLNLNHDGKQVVKDVFMLDNFIIDEAKGISVPKLFEGQDLKDGTWIASYKIEDDELWEDLKAGKYSGFSVEGIFNMIKSKPTTNKMSENIKLAKGHFAKISEVSKWDIEVDQSQIDLGTILTISWKNEKGLVQGTDKVRAGEYTMEDGKRLLVDSDGIVRLIFKNENMSEKKSLIDIVKSLFTSADDDDKTKKVYEKTATLEDGTVVYYDGDLAVGTPIMVEVDGVMTQAPEGTHILDSGIAIVVDVEGKVSEIIEPNSEDVMSREEVAEAMSMLADKLTSKFAQMLNAKNQEIETLKTEFAAFKGQVQEPTKSKYKTVKQILNNK